MSYYFSRTLSCGFDEVVQRTTKAMKNAGFSITTEIDVKETSKKKPNADFRNDHILGACNLTMAREALEIEDKIGTTEKRDAASPCRINRADAALPPPKRRGRPPKTANGAANL